MVSAILDFVASQDYEAPARHGLQKIVFSVVLSLTIPPDRWLHSQIIGEHNSFKLSGKVKNIG